MLTSEMQCFHPLDASATDSEERVRYAMGKELRERSRLRAVPDFPLSGTSGSTTLLEWRVLRTQAAAHQYRDVWSSLLSENPSAGPQCSGDLLQSTSHGGGAASRRHKIRCILDASLPRQLTCRYSRFPAHGTGSQRVEKSQLRQNKRSISADRVESFVDGFDHETIPVNCSLCFVGSGDVLSSQTGADEALVSPHFY